MQFHRIDRSDGGVSIVGLLPTTFDGQRVISITRMDDETVKIVLENGQVVSVLGTDFDNGVFPGHVAVYPALNNEIKKHSPEQQQSYIGNSPIQRGNLPVDRTFRNAWVSAGNTISVDMPRARIVLQNMVRVGRVPLLQALDSAYLQADERGDPQAKRDIAAKKQLLRDAPADQRIQTAQTPDQLKALLPVLLSV